MNLGARNWAEEFQIQSMVELDFVIGQGMGFPVGMQRVSPPEFRRRVLAATVSYQLQLKSIDYALKRYVDSDLYERDEISLGEFVSDYLRNSVGALEQELKKLHTSGDISFGVFGSELSLFRIPYAIDTARMLANRGQLLEVLPILRLCIEMMCWAKIAFDMKDEDEIMELKAQSCITRVKDIYPTVGKLYGLLSKYSHWGHVIHGQFLSFENDEVGVLKASVRYRAITLALCLVVLDAFVEIVRRIYSSKSDALVISVLGQLERNSMRATYKNLSSIAEWSEVGALREIQSLIFSEPS